MEIKNILGTRAYELTDKKNIPVIKNWLGQKGLKLIKTFTNEKKEKCRTTKGLFSVFSNKFKSWKNKIVISLQYHELHRKSNESDQEWMGRLWTRAAECEYKEYDRLLIKQFRGGLNDEGMLDEIIRDVVTL